MYKKIISLILMISLIFSLTTPSLGRGKEVGEENLEIEFKLDKDTYNIEEYITGTGIIKLNGTGVSGKEVTLLVEDFETGLSIYTIGQCTTGENGKFNVKFKMPSNISSNKYKLKLKHSNASKTCNFTISKDNRDIKLASIKILSDKTSIKVGSKLQLKLTGKMSDGSSASNDELKEVKWSSSNESIVKVSDDGLVKAVRKGKATITAKLGQLEDSIVITVKKETYSNDDRKDSNNDKKDKEIDKETNEEGKTKDIVEEYIEFKDVGSDLKWAKNAIEVLAKMDVIEGVGNNYFKPNDNITRAAFAKLIVKAFQLDGSGEKIMFKDVPEGKWYSEYIQIAASKGIIVGYNNEFRPNDEITREEMAVIIARTLKCVLSEYNEANLNFEDAELISDWAKESVAIASANGIINGVGNNKFAPKDLATRAQAAVIVYRLLVIAGLI